MLSFEALSKTKQVIFNAPYLVLSYDEVIVVNNTSWISIHCYVVQDIISTHFYFVIICD